MCPLTGLGADTGCTEMSEMTSCPSWRPGENSQSQTVHHKNDYVTTVVINAIEGYLRSLWSGQERGQTPGEGVFKLKLEGCRLQEENMEGLDLPECGLTGPVSDVTGLEQEEGGRELGAVRLGQRRGSMKVYGTYQVPSLGALM